MTEQHFNQIDNLDLSPDTSWMHALVKNYDSIGEGIIPRASSKMFLFLYFNGCVYTPLLRLMEFTCELKCRK